MTRAVLFVLLLAGTFSLVLSATPAAAQVCTPGCGTGNICVFSGEGTSVTQCIPAAQNGTVSEVVVTAAPKTTSGSFKSIVEGMLIPLGNGIIALLFAAAFLLFIYGIFSYFFVQGADAKARAAGRGFILWGLIGLAVMFSVWGLVRLVMGILPPV